MQGYYRRARSVASRVVDGEAVLVKMPECVLYVLNASAAAIWVEADGVRPAEELAGGRDPSAAAAFLDGCVELGLMERADTPLAEADAFPQEVELAPSAERPEIRASEPVETLAGPTCSSVDWDCTPPSNN